jgi:isoamylase
VIVETGHSRPAGAHVVDGGVNFTVSSEHAMRVELLLFERPDDAEPAAVVPLTRRFHFWHAFVRGAGPGTAYAYRADGPTGGGFRFDARKALLDPYLATPRSAVVLVAAAR